MQNSNITSRIVAPCSDGKNVDFQSFIEYLLLYEKYILHSMRLTEIPHLVNAFGYNGVMQLLTSNVIDIHCDSMAIGEVGQSTGWLSKEPKSPLPLGYFKFIIVKRNSHEEYIDDCMNNINQINNVGIKKRERLKSKILKHIKKYPDDGDLKLISQFNNDLNSNIPTIRDALIKQIKRNIGEDINTKDVKISLKQVDNSKFYAETNIDKLFNINKTKTHSIIEGALLGISELNRKLLEMEIYNATTGFKDSDISIFDSKLIFLEKSLFSEGQINRFRRVVNIKNFPDIQKLILNKEINLQKLIEIRESSDCKEFRNWLWSIDELKDKELEERLKSFRSLFPNLIRSKAGKTLRWLITTGLGFIGPHIGIPISIIDSFLVDKVIKKNGAITFINDLYPSIFKN